MNQFQENANDNSDFSWEDEIDLENLEMPQLVRRNGTTGAADFQAHIILEKNVSHIYNEEICPICLCEEKELYPLRCGHTFCENDIEIMLQNSKQNHNLLACPLCRQYQCIDSFQEVSEFKKESKLLVQNSQQIS